MNKIKEWIKSKRKDIVYLLFILNIVIWAFAYVTTKNFYEYLEDLEIRAMQAQASELTKEEKVIKKELPMKDWVLNEFEKNGLNKNVADCVIWKESGWNDNALNAGSVDLGLLQWNVQHIKSGHITISCAGDYKCATQKAIEKIKADKGWSAWYGYRNNNCQRFGNTFN